MHWTSIAHPLQSQIVFCMLFVCNFISGLWPLNTKTKFSEPGREEGEEMTNYCANHTHIYMLNPNSNNSNLDFLMIQFAICLTMSTTNCVTGSYCLELLQNWCKKFIVHYNPKNMGWGDGKREKSEILPNL